MTPQGVPAMLLLGWMDVQYLHSDEAADLLCFPDGDLPLGVVNPKDVHQTVDPGLEPSQTVVQIDGPAGRRIEGQPHMDSLSTQRLSPLR